MRRRNTKSEKLKKKEEGGRGGEGKTETWAKPKRILTSLAVCADSMSAYCISAWKVPETKQSIEFQLNIAIV